MTFIRKIAFGCAASAMLFTSTAPALAADFNGVLSVHNVSGGDIFQSSNDNHRRHRNRHHRDGIDEGDIVAGIGILAGIAIIAGIASKSNKNKRRTQGDQYPDSYPQDRYPQDSSQDTRDAVPDTRNDGSNELGAAVDACSRAAEQKAGGNSQVEEIESVKREGAGWQVYGKLSNGDRSFSCTASNGAVDTIRLDDGRDI